MSASPTHGMEYGPLFESILQNADQGVAAFGSDARLITCNAAFTELLRLGMSLISRGDAQSVVDHAAGLAESPETFRRQFRDALEAVAQAWPPRELTVLQDGTILEWQVTPLLVYGRRHGWVWTVSDVTAREARAQHLRRLERRLNQVRELAPLATWELDAKTWETVWSDEVYNLFGLDRGSAASLDDAVLVRFAPEALERGARDLAKALETGEPLHGIYPIRLASGETRMVRTVAHAVRDASGEITSLIGTTQDITATEHHMVTVAGGREQLLAAAAAASIPTAIVGPDGSFTLLNGAFADTVGLGVDHVSEVTLWDVFERGGDDDRLAPARVLETGGYAAVRRHRSASGRSTESLTVATVLPGAGEVVVRLIDRVDHDHEPDSRDALTGLANSAEFNRRLAQALTEARAATLLLIDLDRFAQVNATLGRAVGDQVLTLCALRIQRTAGDAFVARVGGQEFAVLTSIGSLDGALALADRFRDAIAAPLELAGTTFTQHATVGVAIGAGPPETLFQEAADAAELAKRRGGDRAQALDDAARAALRQEARRIASLRRALERSELGLAFQPIMSFQDGSTAGLASMLHWEDLPESHSVELAERAGLILPLGRWVMRAVCRQIARWRAQGLDVPTVFVNVTPAQLESASFISDLQAALEESGLTADALVLDLFQAAVSDLSPNVTEVLRDLGRIGCRVVVDGFGSVSSNLPELAALSLHALKLDHGLVGQLPEGTQARAIASVATDLARSLGLPVVASGVETAAQFEAVRAVGCALGQGSFLCRPVVSESVPRVLAESSVPAIGNDDGTMSPGVAADALGISPTTLRRWTQEGRVRAVRTPGGHRRVLREDVDRELASRKRPMVRVPEPPGSAMPRSGAAIHARLERIRAAALRSAYVGDDYGWFSTPAGQRELERWLSQVASAFAAGTVQRIERATIAMLDAARRGRVSLVERAAVVDGVVAAIHATVSSADTEHEIADVRRSTQLLRRIVMQQG